MDRKLEPEIFRLLPMYTPRQIDVILCDPGDLDRPIGKSEMKKLIACCDKLGDADTISKLYSKYDVSSYINEPEQHHLSDEEYKSIEEDIEVWMRRFSPDYKIPSAKEGKKRKK